MTDELLLSVCVACGRACFPPRLWCPRCGRAELRPEPATAGTVEVVTDVRHAADRPAGSPVQIALVQLDAGERIVARLDAPAGPGTPVVLKAVDGAPVASPLR